MPCDLTSVVVVVLQQIPDTNSTNTSCDQCWSVFGLLDELPEVCKCEVLLVLMLMVLLLLVVLLVMVLVMVVLVMVVVH